MSCFVTAELLHLNEFFREQILPLRNIKKIFYKVPNQTNSWSLLVHYGCVQFEQCKCTLVLLPKIRMMFSIGDWILKSIFLILSLQVNPNIEEEDQIIMWL